MYCKNCGNEISANSRFCSQCGSPVTEEQAPLHNNVSEDTAPAAAPETTLRPEIEEEQPAVMYAAPEKTRKFEEFKWNVDDYPGRGAEKTEDVDFDWNADPADNPGEASVRTAAVPSKDSSESDLRKAQQIHNEQSRVTKPASGAAEGERDRPLSASDRIDKFYTFNRKNEEFQQLLNREYEKVKAGNTIENELSEADTIVDRKFEARSEDPSMEAFLEREGAVRSYQPKAFQSDVLQRIEAQEAAKEARKAEEEARIAAIEKARQEAEAESKARAEAEAAKLAEIAGRKAAEEAELAEKARIRAEEEAKRKAEEDARRQAEEEARLRAEAEEKVKAAEEARLRAEADLKAAQEAARIRAQQEARLAAEEEARFRASQEKKQIEAIEAQRRLEEKRKRLAEEANQAVAEAEVRKVIEQTTRMKDDEAAKIRAAVAAMRNGIEQKREGNVLSEVEEAHQATRNQINEMAKARDTFFSDFHGSDAGQAAEQSSQQAPQDSIFHTRTVDKAAVMAGMSRATVTAGHTATAAPENDDAFFSSFEDAPQQTEQLELENVNAEETETAAVPQNEAPEAPAAEEATVQQEGPAAPEETENVDDLLMQFQTSREPAQEAAAQDDAFADADFAAGHTIRMHDDDLEKTQRIDQRKEFGGEDAVNDFNRIASANDFDNYGNQEAAAYIRQQHENRNNVMNDFYDGGAADDEDESQLSRKELRKRKKEQKRREKERAKEEKILKKRDADFDNMHSEDAADPEEGSTKGRLALKIVLGILIVILAAEILGMGIRFIAPQSRAAEFIDNQLNKVIQLITGDDTEYSVIAAQARTEAPEDKTDLINSQKDRNINGNIKSITYNAELAYDEKRDSEETDLVLSQPMAQVEWGRDQDNYPVYYDEQVIGEIIAFESAKAELMKNGDEEIMSMIKPDTDLYSEISALKNKGMQGGFDSLEIGEIREAGTCYYVWVRETIGGSSSDKVYAMYPEKEFVMKMMSSYTI